MTSSPDLEKAHNDGQCDGANGDYQGMLDSGRSPEEQEAYDRGYHYGAGTRDGADDNYEGTWLSGRNAEQHEKYNEGHEAGRRSRDQ